MDSEHNSFRLWIRRDPKGQDPKVLVHNVAAWTDHRREHEWPLGSGPVLGVGEVEKLVFSCSRIWLVKFLR